MIPLTACEPVAAYADITTEDWLRLRRTGIGGSDAGAIMGYSRYGSALTVVLEKTGRVPISEADNEYTEVGKILEPIIRRELVGQYIKERLGLDAEVLDPTHMYRSLAWPWMLCNPDGFLRFADGPVMQDVGLEIKTGSSYQLRHWGGADGNEVPDAYYCQVQHYMAVTGLSEWWIFGLIGNQRVLRIVPRNEEFIASLVAREKDVWEIIRANDPLLFPAPNGSDADMEALVAAGAGLDDTVVDMAAYETDVLRYLDLKIEIDDRAEERERIKQRIVMAMDRSRRGETPDHELSISRYASASIDDAKLKRDHPGLVEAYTTYTESARLYVRARRRK